VADIGPQRVELGTGELEVREQECFDPFDMIGRDPQPVHNRFFFDAFHTVNGGQTIPFGQQGQAFQDGVLGVMPTIEDGSDRFNKGAATCATLMALGAGLCAAKPTDVAAIHETIIGTIRIPAKRAGMYETALFHIVPPHIDALLMIHQHEEGRQPPSG
jgi:hypothetical protein